MDSGYSFRVLAGCGAGDQTADDVAPRKLGQVLNMTLIELPIMILGSPVPLLCILIILKVGVDIWLHTKSYKAIASEKIEKHRDQKVESGTEEKRKIQVRS
jgi:hypothetical protein